MEHKEVNALMERWAEKAAAERSGRKLILHTEVGTPTADRATQNTPTVATSRSLRLRRWSWAAASIAAAVVVGAAIFTTPAPEPASPVICTVNGKLVTDPASIEQYTREALELADENLRRPGVILAQTLVDDLTTTRVGEMLNELTNNR